MQSLEIGGYSKKEVMDVIHGRRGPRQLRFRYDLLDKNNQFIKTLTTVKSGEVSMNSLEQIKRTARFSLVDNGEINWISDRIQPFVELKMPEIKRKHDTYALELDGIDDRIHFDSILYDDLEITFNYSSEQKTGLPTIFNHNGQSSSGSFIWIYTSGTNRSLNIQVGNDGYQTKTLLNFIDFDTWITAKFVFKGNDVDVYKNGVFFQKLTYTNTTKPPTAGMPFIGTYQESSNYYFKGIVSSVTIGNNKYEFSGSGSEINATGKRGTISGATWQKNGIEIKTIPSQHISYPQGIFLLSSPTRKDETGKVIRDVEAFGGLIILRDDKFEQRYIVPAGAKYYDEVIKILQSAGIAQYNIEYSDAVLQRDIEFEAGKEKLFAINELLRQINYTPIYDDANGVFVSAPYRSPAVRTAEYTYKDDELSVTYQGMEEELDLFNVPNKWIVVCSNTDQDPLVSSYTNDNPDSPTSTVNRGFSKVDSREVSDIADQVTLDAYVQRIAFEASQVYGKINFETALMPFHEYSDVLDIDYSPLGIKGKYSETSWTMPLSVGGKMKHEVRKVVTI